MNRREFFSVLGSGIAITLATVNTSYGLSADALPENQIGAWLHIGEDGAVTIYSGKAEVGQNIRTSLAQVVAEELDVPMEKITMILGDTTLTPYDRGTFGSRSTPYMGPQLRKAAASARELILDLAATEWKTERSLLYISKGNVTNPDTKQMTPIGKIVKGKQLVQAVDEKVVLKKIDAWKIAGTSVKKVNGESFVTGQHKYVSDMKLTGMLYGKILRAPAYGATLVSADISDAKKIPGVVVVHDKNFIGVAAGDLSTANKALQSIKAEWKFEPQPSRKEIFDHLRNTSKNDDRGKVSGDVSTAFSKAAASAEQTFHVDYIAHVPLEPRAGVAQWEGNKLTVWTGTQRPFGVQEDLADVFQMPKENIRVIQPDTGSGYGGKHTGEAGVEAARLAKEAGTPVKVVWTREEEFTWAYFRPAGVIDVKAGADKSGILTSWEFHNYNSGGSGIDTPYEVKNTAIQFHPSDSPLRQGSYRGLAATANNFARESIMDDLAAELKIDPLEFRLKNLSEQRMKDVLEAAAKAFGWRGAKPEKDHGFGIACGEEKGSYVAACAEIAFDRNENDIKVLRAAVAFECGGIINPNHLENQITGSIIQGLGGALFEWIDFKDGKILNPKFSAYRVPRFGDVPKLDIVMLNRKDIPPAGAGETPIIGIAPAVRNAIVNATGKRLYTLPLVPRGLEV
ncbi:isoquinoline 1-oxidoreductase [Chryseolinea soli]|uniref:Isoquinoline 1-oxidoreductase n=2 Tax=Chryseolinea soli TaxID=2321403 RepID=A0A385SYF6_9BACT|nr:isoquinoline 1-oxidoreductase [Chryseolinea soli]